jgi:hypothetical protein
MQTFLAYPSFNESMQVLDDSRLGNQVYREGMTLLRGNWPNHPASKMWRGYEDALALYLWAGVIELGKRGKDYDDRPWCIELRSKLTHSCPMPPWLGDKRVHSSHRANLLRKDPVWYGQFGWTEAPTEGYYWPVK